MNNFLIILLILVYSAHLIEMILNHILYDFYILNLTHAVSNLFDYYHLNSFISYSNSTHSSMIPMTLNRLMIFFHHFGEIYHDLFLH